MMVILRYNQNQLKYSSTRFFLILKRKRQGVTSATIFILINILILLSVEKPLFERLNNKEVEALLGG